MSEHDPDLTQPVHTRASSPVELDDDALPVVARMVVEIRSDGSRTVARGAVEDLLNDQQVAVEAKADSPLELSRALTKLLFSAPFGAGSALLRGPTAQSSPLDHEPIDSHPPRGLRGRVGTLGRRLSRKVGQRVGRALQERLLGDSEDSS